MTISWQLLNRLNMALGGIAIVLMLLTVSYWWGRPGEVFVSEVEARVRPLPKNPFARQQEAYNAIQTNLFTLNFATPPLQLPNLRNSLIFYGISDRPDVPKDSKLLHFALASGKSEVSIPPGEKLYMMYDRIASPGQYVFSPNNTPTPLWLESDILNEQAVVSVGMRDDKGNLIRSPDSNLTFNLDEREYVQSSGTEPFKIGNYRVDATLLARQRARWYGKDIFLEQHGGDEYAPLAEKQRVDFQDGDNKYSVYASMNDTLIWQDSKWVATPAGKETRGYPLLQIKRIDERILGLDLWDGDGKIKISLNLLKSKEPWLPDKIEEDFKFIAARTRSQYVVEIKDEKTILRPHDWLLLTDKGWKKMETEQEIDDYVDGKMTGTLFIFDGVDKKDDKQILTGTLYNASRTEAENFELAIPTSNVTVIKVPKKSLEPEEPYTNGFHD